ncbi:MAG: UDP-3-O-acyl-N-acetylglucosamine deacetylase [Desulfobulbus sp.]|jgi:UDP-3-O-[3-hydroxymyristoyl] N-acetylglucosamine deacetylase
MGFPPVTTYNQHTVQHPVSCFGVGLHTGEPVHLSINPAAANTGIHFVRTDLPGQPVISAGVEQVVTTTLATTIGVGRDTVSTTEHLLAALSAKGVDNARIEVSSAEVPIMDGSAGPFIRLLDKAGLRCQDAPRKVLRIIRPVAYSEGDKSIRIEPCNSFKVSARIQFDDELIREQHYSLDVTPERFRNEVAFARTFGFVEQVEALWELGLALGGTLDNVIAIHWNRKSVLNEGGLRFDNEFIRHKVLDIIGDMALLGVPLQGHVIADRSGHGLHVSLLQTLLATPQAWEYITPKQPAPVAASASDSRFSPLFHLKPTMRAQATPCAL